MKIKAYSYIRFSTRDQIQGDSQRRQAEAAAKWCKANGVEFVEAYRDLGVSAFRGKNAQKGALADFLAFVKKGRIPKGSYLIVESLDRISRNEIMEAFDLFRDIIKAGITIVTLSDGHVYTAEKINGSFADLIISLSVMCRAHEESKIKSQRIGSAWEAKRRNASTVKMTVNCVPWLRLSEDRKRFEPIPERVKVVRRIFDMARKGHGANGITKTLRREGVPTFVRALAWHISYVRKILDNRAVIGEFTPTTLSNGKRVPLEPIPNYYLAVVDRKLFATVQQLRKARPSYKGKSSFNVFSKLAFDRETRSPMTYVTKSRVKGWHYLVSAAALRQQAKYQSWRYDEFLGYFLFVCQNAALQRPPAEELNNGELNVAQMELEDTEKKIARLVDFLADGKSGSVESKLRELELRKVELQQRVKDAENEYAAKPADMSKVNWKDNDAMRENLRATVKRITVDAASKWFRAEFLDGRVYEFAIKDGKATITTPDYDTVKKLQKYSSPR